MKIERVSENQLKLTLTRADLVERDLKLEDLINPSDKTQKLFRDIMEQALDEYDFINESTPLMVEAVPVGIDGIMIIVTKIDQKNKSENPMDLLFKNKEAHKWKKKPLDLVETKDLEGEDILIFSFQTLDDAIDASLRLDDCYRGESALFKSNERFFLVLQADTYTADENNDYIELILDEFGQKHISTTLSKYFLLEHGEAMIKANAVASLAKAFG
ncbi:adaptor protein MecA [Anaerotignum propionicum]|jgi:adapter protein MecA 1/2|uniref:Adapter protein MecA 1/2 n=1 Tax=Anaerotignum propionicum DSM 1682 TaxID=991789 RepID=A0A0X8VEU4_ANAPI|nr:adaptor protein MecA [Anaerotignum propionicum]AMJ42430.1 adapter protein MecA 2 [Anaerotignum propionicum DSM 1682]SHE34758.1 adapter protein MecA 1/2 [[Clostridium] propionicum DSM 1682] [Anaerotignum propionicum DSM 1682]HBF64819.1 adaptor protein MecA [Clostridium sp.]